MSISKCVLKGHEVHGFLRKHSKVFISMCNYLEVVCSDTTIHVNICAVRPV